MLHTASLLNIALLYSPGWKMSRCLSGYRKISLTHTHTHTLPISPGGRKVPPEALKEHPLPLLLQKKKQNSQKLGLKASPQITKHGCPHGASLSIAVSITFWPHHEKTNLHLQAPKKTLMYSTSSSQLLHLPGHSDSMPINNALHSTLQHWHTPIALTLRVPYLWCHHPNSCMAFSTSSLPRSQTSILSWTIVPHLQTRPPPTMLASPLESKPASSCQPSTVITTLSPPWALRKRTNAY